MITHCQKITCTILICTIVCYSVNAINSAIEDHEGTATYDNATEVNRRKRDSNIRKLELLCKYWWETDGK